MWDSALIVLQELEARLAWKQPQDILSSPIICKKEGIKQKKSRKYSGGTFYVYSLRSRKYL